jgi:hypothetical protein
MESLYFGKFSMVKVDLTDSLIEKAGAYSKGKIYKRSMRGQEGTNIGTIGELVLIQYLEDNGIKVIDNRNRRTATKYDLLVLGEQIEVKTKDRTVPPKPFYECSVPLYNHTHQKPKWFIFLSLLRKDNKYVEAYILGAITYSDMERDGITMTKGDVDLSNGWVCNESCINIAIDKLITPEKMLENWLMALNPLGYNPIIDIDELHNRNRRGTDDPYIKATMENADYKRWKNNNAERR